MNKRMFVIAIWVVSAAAGQTAKIAAKSAPAKKVAAPHTPWSDPDLQGVWNDATGTPLQRPTGVGSKDVLSDEDAAEFQDKLAGDLSLERKDGTPDADVNRGFNEHWDDARRLKITADPRTGLIIDPPEGRIPPLMPLSKEQQEAPVTRAPANARFAAGLPDSYLDMSLPVRCIIRTDSPPYLPTIYNNDFHILGLSPGLRQTVKTLLTVR